MSETFLADIHGNHNTYDDGKDTIGNMVRAAARQGIIPAMTLHNNMNVRPAFGAYMKAMEQCGLAHVALPGIEWEFSVDASNVAAAKLTSPTLGMGIFPSVQSVGRARKNEAMQVQFVSHEEIVKERDRLVIVVEKNKKLARLINEDIGFATFYLRSFSRLGNNGLEAKSQILGDPEYEGEFIKIMYAEYKKYKKDPIKFQRQKGELLCIMPPDKQIMERMTDLVEHWVKEGWTKKGSLQLLQGFLQANLTPEQFDSLLFVLPHFASLDAKPWGKIITHIMEGDTALYVPEIFVPEVAAKVHGIEVLNGAVPDWANRISVLASKTDLLKNKAKTGGGDAHCVEAVGGAVTLGKASRLKSDALIEAVKLGETLPVSGWGELSNTIAPFLFWALTVPIDNKTHAPRAVYDLMAKMIDIQTPTKRALVQGLISARSSVRGWYY